MNKECIHDYENPTQERRRINGAYVIILRCRKCGDEIGRRLE